MILYTICWSHFLHLSSIINLVVSCFPWWMWFTDARFKVGTKRLLPRPLCECNEMWATSFVIFGVSWNQKGWGHGKLLFCYSILRSKRNPQDSFEWHKIYELKLNYSGKTYVYIMKYEEAKANYKLIYNWTSQDQDVQEPTAILTKPSTVLPTPTDSFRHSRAFFANWLDNKGFPQNTIIGTNILRVAPCLLGFPQNDQFLEDWSFLKSNICIIFFTNKKCGQQTWHHEFTESTCVSPSLASFCWGGI